MQKDSKRVVRSLPAFWGLHRVEKKPKNDKGLHINMEVLRNQNRALSKCPTAQQQQRPALPNPCAATAHDLRVPICPVDM